MQIRLSNRIWASVFLIVSLSLFAVAARAVSPFDIEFPVKELGNCVDQKACKAYCDISKNEAACSEFARNRGFDRGPRRADDDSKFDVINQDGGPGNCAAGGGNPKAACEKFCNDSSNIQACVAYAKTHNLMNKEELAEAEKVAGALQRGVKLPVGCTNKASCQLVCDNPGSVAVMRSCFEFAEAAGLLPPDVSREQAEKMFTLIESGKAPFTSPRDFKKCENPESDEVLQSCISFAIESGMMNPKEAERVRKTGGKGPGNCRGKEQCDRYCEQNPDECAKFIEEHGLMSEEDRTRMREGQGQMKKAIEQAPPEVVACFKSTLGEEVFAKIQSGAQPPSRELGDKMQRCFEQFFGKDRGEEPGDSDQGKQGEGGIMGPPQEFEQDGRRQGLPGENMNGKMPPFKGGQRTQPRGPQMPSEVAECLRSQFGDQYMEKMRMTNGRPPVEMEESIRSCYAKMMRSQGQSPEGRSFNEMRGEQPRAMNDQDRANGTFNPPPGEMMQGGFELPPSGAFTPPPGEESAPPPPPPSSRAPNPLERFLGNILETITN